MTDPDITPPHGVPIVQITTAQVRDGRHFVEADVATRPTDVVDAMDAIRRARALFTISPLPRADITWPHLRSHLLVAEARLQRQVRENPQDDESGVLLQEVRRFLGRQS